MNTPWERTQSDCLSENGRWDFWARLKTHLRKTPIAASIHVNSGLNRSRNVNIGETLNSCQNGSFCKRSALDWTFTTYIAAEIIVTYVPYTRRGMRSRILRPFTFSITERVREYTILLVGHEKRHSMNKNHIGLGLKTLTSETVGGHRICFYLPLTHSHIHKHVRSEQLFWKQ